MSIDRIFLKLHSAKVFSTIDIRSGYYNITVAKDSWQYTAFTTEYGKYEFLGVPFSTKIAPSYFALNVNETLKGLDFCFAYLDDIIIYPKTEQHPDHNRHVFNWLWTANIKLKMTKCNFFNSKIHYVRQLLSEDGISPLWKKLDAIRTMLPSKNIKKLRQFLCLTDYYGNHINHYIDITNALTKLLKKDEPYIWTELYWKSF